MAVQTERVLQNLVAVLREAKMGPENVVKTTVYLADMADFPKMNEVYAPLPGAEAAGPHDDPGRGTAAWRESRDRRHRGVLVLRGAASRPLRLPASLRGSESARSAARPVLAPCAANARSAAPAPPPFAAAEVNPPVAVS